MRLRISSIHQVFLETIHVSGISGFEFGRELRLYLVEAWQSRAVDDAFANLLFFDEEKAKKAAPAALNNFFASLEGAVEEAFLSARRKGFALAGLKSFSMVVDVADRGPIDHSWLGEGGRGFRLSAKWADGQNLMFERQALITREGASYSLALPIEAVLPSALCRG